MKQFLVRVYLIIRRILVWIFFILILSYVGCYIFVGTIGVKFFQEKLTQIFQRPCQIAQIYFLFPFVLRFEGIKIEGLISAKTIEVDLGWLDPFNRTMSVRSLFLDEPLMFLTRYQGIDFHFSETLLKIQEKQEASAPNPPQQKIDPGIKRFFQDLRYKIKQVSVQNGQLQIYHHTDDKEYEMLLGEMDFKAKEFLYPWTNDILYHLKAVLFKKGYFFSGNRVESQGWINWNDKNMFGNFQILSAESQVILLATLESKDNQMIVRGRLMAKEVAKLPGIIENRKAPPDSLGIEDVSALLVKSARGFLESSNLEVSINFSFQTLMDDFHIDPISFSGQIESPEANP